jgi:hypothetical protein
VVAVWIPDVSDEACIAGLIRAGPWRRALRSADTAGSRRVAEHMEMACEAESLRAAFHERTLRGRAAAIGLLIR